MISPLRGYIVAKTITRTNKTKSGLDLPEEISKDLSQEAEIVAVGLPIETAEGTKLYAPTHDNGEYVKPGDVVLYRPFTGVRYGEHLILHFNELVAVVK